MAIGLCTVFKQRNADTPTALLRQCTREFIFSLFLSSAQQIPTRNFSLSCAGSRLLTTNAFLSRASNKDRQHLQPYIRVSNFTVKGTLIRESRQRRCF